MPGFARLRRRSLAGVSVRTTSSVGCNCASQEVTTALNCYLAQFVGLRAFPARPAVESKPDHGAQMRFQIGHLETKSPWMIYIQA